jgi:hypothetical protein
MLEYDNPRYYQLELQFIRPLLPSRGSIPLRVKRKISGSVLSAVGLVYKYGKVDVQFFGVDIRTIPTGAIRSLFLDMMIIVEGVGTYGVSEDKKSGKTTRIWPA